MKGTFNLSLEQILLKFFENTNDYIFLFNRDGEIVLMNDAARGILTEDVYETLLSGQTESFCEVCRGHTTEANIRTCDDCYILESDEDKESFQVYLETEEKGMVPYFASFATIDDSLGIRMLTLRNISDQIKTQEQLFQKMQMNRVIRAQEDERKRISRELHDSVAQELLSLLIEIRLMKYITDNKEIIDRIRDSEEKLAQILEDIQFLSVELRPSTLDDLGLGASFRAHFKMVEKNYGVLVRFQSNIGTKRYAQEIETNIYRICQEAVLNAIKYAEVDEITVQLFEEEQLFLIVSDQGKGFSLNKIRSQGTGLGLYGMRERAELMNGILSIQSEIDEGTCIQLQIPL